MSKNTNVLILNPPSPPYKDVCRDYAGGFGVAWDAKRPSYGQTMKPCFHPFLPYVSAVLSHETYNHNVLDCQKSKLDDFQVLRNVKRMNPDVILSLIGLPSMKKDVELLNEIKRSLPNASIIGVGTVCRFLQEDILLRSKIDAVLGNGYPYISNIVNLIEAISAGHDLSSVLGISYSARGKIRSTPESADIGFDKMLPPRYDDLELDGYDDFADRDGNTNDYVPILVGMGCPYPCTYCPYPVGFGRRWTHKSLNDIADEMEYLSSRGLRGVSFRDQSFLMDRKHATAVCQEIIRRKLDMAWLCEARVDQVSKDLLELMKRSGCKRIHYGVETGDPTLIQQGKPGIVLETTKKAFRLTKELGIWTNAHVVLGWPDEDLETIAKTYRFLLEIAPDSINWNFLTPYPGTKLHQIAKENDLLLTDDWSKYTSHTIVMKTKWLSAKQLQKTANRIRRGYEIHRMIKLVLSAGKRPLYATNELKRSIKGYTI